MTERIDVTFTVPAGGREAFLLALQQWDSTNNVSVGWRADDQVSRRAALEKFANEMELVLRKHDHKKSWRDRPIQALVRMLSLEFKEFRAALEFFEASEARKELIDVANYCLICWDRLGLLDQERNVQEQITIRAAE